MRIFALRRSWMLSLLLLFLLFCNAVTLHAQPKFINEANGLFGYNFSDVASFLLLLGIAESFLSLGGFLGGACFIGLLCIAVVDVFFLALPLKIIFDDTLLAFTDKTSLNGYFYAFPVLFFISAIGGILFKKNLPTEYKSLLFWLIFTCLLGVIALFSGAHSALDKKDFLPWHKANTAEILSKKTENGAFDLLTGKWAHKLRESWGGLPGDLGFILTSLPASNQIAAYNGTRAFPQELKKIPPSSPASHTILLIMGESSNPFHYGIYGYPIPTTPSLERLERKGLACHLIKAHSVANNTRYAVLPSISFWQPDNASMMMKSHTIMTLATQEDFQTYWLSKQIENNFYAGFIGLNIETTANLVTPNESHGIYRYAATRPLNQWNNPDEDLLPLLHQAFTDEYLNHFIGLHLIGSHIPYRFRSTQEDIKKLPHASWYDRSIHATDRLLSKTYQEASKHDPDTLILYLSDHGEDLENGGHSSAYGELQYQIPLIFIGKNAQQWCAEAKKFRQKNGWYSSLSNNLLISEMLGYQVKSEFLETRKKKDQVLLPNQKAGVWEKIPKRLLN